MISDDPERDPHTSGWHLADCASGSLSEVKGLCETYSGLSVVPERPEARLLYWFRAGRVGAVTDGELRFGDEVGLLGSGSSAVYLAYVPLTGRMSSCGTA